MNDQPIPDPTLPPGASVGALLAKLASLRREREAAAARFAPRVAPGFSPFALFAPGETTLSRLIAHLLDPTESHAQDDLFLRLLLDRLGLDWPGEATKGAVASVERPARMDVFVEGLADGRAYRLAIENKLHGAEDQDRQIARYFEAIEGRKPDGSACVVYLTVEGGEPTAGSFPDGDRTPDRENGLRLMAAVELADWLEDCQARAKAPSVATHAAAFRDYVTMNLLGVKESEMDEIVDAIVGDPERARAFVRALSVEHDAKDRLLAKLRDDLEAALTARGLQLDDWKLSQWHTWRHVWIVRATGSGGPKVSIEFKRTQLAVGAMGLLGVNALGPGRADAAFERLVERYGPGGDDAPGAGGEEDDWVWWQTLDRSPLDLPNDWRHAPDVWAMMASGELAERIADVAKAMFDAINGV